MFFCIGILKSLLLCWGLLIYIAMLGFFLAMHVMALIHSFHVISEPQSHYEGF